jgi:hypothetical protein
VVHSKLTIKARCFGCGRRYLDGHTVEVCPRCCAWFNPSDEQRSVIALEGAKGRFRLDRWPTCGCERDESAAPSIVRRSTWRRCAVCRAPLASTASRATFCGSCAKRKRRELNREQARKSRNRRQRLRADYLNETAARSEPTAA